MQAKYQEIIDVAGEILLGKEKELKKALVCLLCKGHILIEDIPGVGKTTLVYLMARLAGLNLSRIQFTNDLLPSDILGTNIFNRSTNSFEFKKGPIFGNLVLADELNRATPKTQSALLQAMEEKSITIDGEEFEMPRPFIVMATQNPLQQIGTYPLPESQLDRFFMSLTLGFPERSFEKKILSSNREGNHELLSPVLDIKDLEEAYHIIQKVQVSETLINYVLDILEVGRKELDEGFSLSPRAGKDLLLAAKGHAFIEGREYVLPDDVVEMAPVCFSHRLGGVKGVLYGKEKVGHLLEQVPIP